MYNLYAELTDLYHLQHQQNPQIIFNLTWRTCIMFEEKLEKAHEILNKAVAMLLKEARVNSFVDGEIFPLPDHVNDEEVLNDLLDIQLKITNLQYKVSNLPVA